MLRKHKKNDARLKRHYRMRKDVVGTAERPRLNVFRSLNNIYAQIINDETSMTLVSASTLDKELRATIEKGGNIEAAKLIGKEVAKRALAKGIEKVVFDRGGYIYHGRIAAVAEGAREAGLQF
ncbi:large subunit ribosomal protein L18 [Sporomusaceae bacterium BoRhaA]|uniref:50S ribosomal protein L18 n=1 Tax=Pelorhabdus rhamnosifermentans TaxID=2772457 RepID=UPI001C062D7A|nr:50S ribosomal protein L18 [Pelorhabdus rhamnosifermentans]MBU2701632.1 large subunit ribosomal protein L18 [Pelorhabdus rhamnosifermentans]